MNVLSSIARRALSWRLRRLKEGRLTLYCDGISTVYGSGVSPVACITVRDERFFSDVAFGGHIGAVESFVEGNWETDNLTAVVQILLRNRQVLDDLETGFASLVQPARALLHAWNRNTRTGSKRNIVAHYDLGNEFFALFLDETMTYSCGVFDRRESSMREASIEKYDRLCRKLGLDRDHHVLEIGTGWGGFAIHAAGKYGCRVTTTTISDEQFSLAAERVEATGLSDRVTLLRSDYRDLTGSFDRIVSIEMIEAVGHQYYETFFAQCANLLKTDGLAAIQAITIQDRFYESARREVDFIKKYIFPGSCIPAVSVLAAAAAQTDLRLIDLEDITPHYAETLRRWRGRFFENWLEIQSLGYGEDFKRLWHAYFSYCEGGFNEAVLGDVQLLFAKPRASGGLFAEAASEREAVA